MIPPTTMSSLATLPTAADAGTKAVPAVRLDAYQPGGAAGGSPGSGGPGLADSFNAAIDGFGTRASQMQASMRDIAMRDAAPAHGPAALDLVPAARGPAAAGPGSAAMGNPMGLMVDSFNFAIEASLVSRAATQFTGAISTLMKGQ